MTEVLPRRAFLGAFLPEDAQAFSGEGMTVHGAVPGLMASEAGLLKGDELLTIAGKPLRSLCELAEAMRYAGRHGEVELVIQRGEEHLTRTVTVQGSPRETLPASQVSYEQVLAKEARLRSIITLPENAPPIGAVLLVQGISCESVDYGADPDHPLAQLLAGWAGAGYMTMRIDKRGVGDSEGCPCSEVDFATELEDFRCALASLVNDPRRQGAPILLFGHSVGGMIAPVLSAEFPVKGSMIYGSSTASWLDCLVASTSRQLEMRGTDTASIEEHLKDLRARVLREGLNGRSADYHRQLHDLDLPACWLQVENMPVLVLCGEYDWVLSREEQISVSEIVRRSHIVDLPRLDHMLGAHESLEESMREYGQGVFHRAVLDQSLEWMAPLCLDSLV